MAATSRLLLLASAAAAHKPHDEPPGSGWAAQLGRTHPTHPLARAAGAQGSAGGRAAVGAAPPPCPNPEWAEAAQPAGLLSVKLFGAQGNRTHDDAPAVRAAINASALCGGCVYFPPGEYFFGSTVVISGHGCFKGSAGHGSVDGLSPPSVNIYGPTQGAKNTGPPAGPPVALIKADSVLLQDLAFHGETTGIYIGASAGVRFVNVGADAGHDADGIDASAEGCNATG